MTAEHLKITYRDLKKLKPYDRNARTHPPGQIEQLRRSLREFGFYSPVLLRDDDETIGVGHGRVEAALLEGIKKGPTITLRGLSDEKWRALVIADNRLAEGAGWNFDLLKLELGELSESGFDIGVTGFELEGLGDLGSLGLPNGGGKAGGSSAGALKERFGVVPFSVLNAREGWWQDRKRSWLDLGIRSEVGRGENLLKMSDTMLEPDPAKRAAAKETASLKGGLTVGMTMHPYDGGKSGPVGTSGTSIFDPVLCELAYRWWAPPAGLVLDPFAGGSVRGIVCAKLGRHYLGVDLRQEQVDANRVQGGEILDDGDATATWLCGDSTDIEELVDGAEADFIFSCPPYADLERYSEDPRDLSTMEYDGFVEAYRQIIAAAAGRLKNDRFACFVVGDVRGPDGAYRGFVRDTELAFEAAGLRLYNEAVLVTAAGSLPMRAGKQFAASRKLGKTHQNVLVFLKGDAKRAVAAIGAVEFGEIDDQREEGDQPPADDEDADFGRRL